MIIHQPCIHEQFSETQIAEIARQNPTIRGLVERESLCGELRHRAGLNACDTTEVSFSNDRKLALIRINDRHAKLYQIGESNSISEMLSVNTASKIMWIDMLETKSGTALIVGVEEKSRDSSMQIFLAPLNSYLDSNAVGQEIDIPARTSGATQAGLPAFAAPSDSGLNRGELRLAGKSQF